MSSDAANRRGIVATSLACVFWTSCDTLGKLATETFPTGQTMAVRGVFAIAIGIAVVAWGRNGRVARRNLHLVFRPAVIWRATFDAAVVFAFYTGLAHMQLADITAISQSTPLIITLLAAAFGVERIGWRRFSAILVGFGGVLLVVKPSANGLTLYALVAVLAAALSAVRDLITRAIDPAVPSAVVALMSATTAAVAGLALGITESWAPLSLAPTSYLAIAGLLVVCGNLAIVIAYRDAELGVIAPFRYLSIGISLVLGYLVFGTLPDAFSFAGILLIMSSGIYTIYREQVRRRSARIVPAALADAPAAQADSRKPA